MFFSADVKGVHTNPLTLKALLDHVNINNFDTENLLRGLNFYSNDVREAIKLIIDANPNLHGQRNVVRIGLSQDKEEGKPTYFCISLEYKTDVKGHGLFFHAMWLSSYQRCFGRICGPPSRVVMFQIDLREGLLINNLTIFR